VRKSPAIISEDQFSSAALKGHAFSR